MHRDDDGSLKSWVYEALAALCPVRIARNVAAWFDPPPAPIPVEARTRRHRRPSRD